MSNDETQIEKINEVTDEDLQNTAIATIEPKYRRLVMLYLSGMYTIKQIATTIGVSPVTIRAWLAKPNIKEAINTYQSEEDDLVKQSLKALRMKAMYKMSDLIDSEVDGIAWQAARDILDRTGHKPIATKEINIEIKTYEQELFDIMKKVDTTDAIDCEYTNIDDED